jgi:opacity protein-like surface antigen
MNKTVAAAALAVAMSSAPAMAVDLAPIVDVPSGHVWDGFYAGVLAGVWSGNSLYMLGGGSLGANFTITDNLVLGVEGRGVVYSDGDIGFDATARLGTAVDDILIYGDAGLGMRDGSGHFFVGGGLEIVVIEDLTVDGRVEFVTGSGFNAIRGTAALNLHF